MELESKLASAEAEADYWFKQYNETREFYAWSRNPKP